MHVRRLAAVMVAAVSLGATVLVAGPAGGSTGATDAACALLSNQQVLASISGAGESALMIRCGLIPGETGVQQGKARPSAPSLGADVLVNDRSTDTWPHITQSETTVASRGQTMLVGYNDSHELPANATGYSRSVDGGVTFTDMGAPTVPLGVVDAVFGDPVLASDRNRDQGDTSVFYFANLGTLSNGTSIVSVHKTVDGGLTWAQAGNATPGALAADFQDKEWLAVDTRSSGEGAGNVYVCWTRFFTGGQQIRLSRSTDGGATFTIIQTDLSSDTDVSGCNIAVDPNNGNVYVAWLNQNNLVSPRTIKFRRSTDQGTTFAAEQQIGSSPIAESIITCGAGSRTVQLDTEPSPNSRAIRSKPFPDIAVNPISSEFYVVFHAGSQPGGVKADIEFVESNDLGVTWSAQKTINTGINGQQFMPSITVNKNGTARAMWYSTQRSATDRLLDVYMTQSTDGGTTWINSRRVTDVSFDRPTTNPNFDTFIASCYMGDYNQVEAAPKGLGNTRLNMTWGDNRLDGNPSMGGVQPDPDVRFDR